LSTDPTLNLPGDATVYLNFLDSSKVDYTLDFGAKAFGIQAIKAASKWACNAQGLVTIVYDKISTDMFGLQNIGVSFFGLLQGRASYVQTAYFDTQSYWMDLSMGPAGEEFLSVYLREE
jgi:hypothetical protein